MKAKVAILGGKGMLGKELMGVLADSSDFEVSAFDLPEFDVTRKEDVDGVMAGVEIVVNCAAYTDVDRAEDEPEKAFAVNGEALSLIGENAKKNGTYVIHISTDFVFDGTLDRPYTEQDTPNPINVYGASKLRGEVKLAQTSCNYCIMRVEWSYGGGGNNFVRKILERAKSQGQPLKVVDDQVGSPTWTRDMANVILFLMKYKPSGTIFHFAASGFASRFDVAKFVLERTKNFTQLIPCKSSDFIMKARRPLNSRFDTTKIQSILPYQIPSWQDSLARFLETIK